MRREFPLRIPFATARRAQIGRAIQHMLMWCMNSDRGTASVGLCVLCFMVHVRERERERAIIPTNKSAADSPRSSGNSYLRKALVQRLHFVPLPVPY